MDLAVDTNLNRVVSVVGCGLTGASGPRPVVETGTISRLTASRSRHRPMINKLDLILNSQCLKSVEFRSKVLLRCFALIVVLRSVHKGTRAVYIPPAPKLVRREGKRTR